MRQQHYRFAHQVLMSAVLRDPAGWWATAATQGNAMLQQAWAAAGDGLGPEDRVDGSSLTIAPVWPAPGVEALLITLPPPQAPTECHYLALVRGAGQPPRYFVMERGIEGDGGAPRAYWAEWRQSPGGIMRIRGADLPAISAEAFLAAAAQACSAPPVGPGAAPWPGGPVPAPAKPKSRAGLFIGAGCLSLFLLVASVGGYLLYQEEGRGLHVPDDEAASESITPDKPFEIQYKWDGTGYAFNNIWLVVDEGTTSGGSFSVRGTLSCSGGSRSKGIEADLSSSAARNVERKGGDAFSAWLYLHDTYEHSSGRTLECSGVLAPVKGQWTKARVVVTQRQRPSDWIAR